MFIHFWFALFMFIYSSQDNNNECIINGCLWFTVSNMWERVWTDAGFHGQRTEGGALWPDGETLQPHHQLSDQVSAHNSKPYYTYLTLSVTNYLTRWVHITQNLITPILPCQSPTIWPGECTQLKTLLHLSHLVSHRLSDQVSAHNSKPYYTYLTLSVTDYLTRWVHTTQNLITPISPCQSPTISPGECTQLKTLLHLFHLVNHQLSDQVSVHNSKPHHTCLTITNHLITSVSPGPSPTISLHLSHLVHHQPSHYVCLTWSITNYLITSVSPGPSPTISLRLSHLVHHQPSHYVCLTWSITNHLITSVSPGPSQTISLRLSHLVRHQPSHYVCLTWCITNHLITSVSSGPSPAISPGEYTQLKTPLQLSHLVHQQLSQ